MSRVVVADKVAPAGLDVLRRAGHEVVELDGQPREKLIEALRDADALLVRSATKVDRELLEAAPRLTVVGRAGVGVDNVDVPAATARGILVINAPTANVVSAVEHTFALLFALLRRVPAAAASMEAGRWDKSKFVGMELSGKTLGIIGLGQVGSRVAVRARAFEAKVLGFDAYLPPARARELGVPLGGFGPRQRGEEEPVREHGDVGAARDEEGAAVGAAGVGAGEAEGGVAG